MNRSSAFLAAAFLLATPVPSFAADKPKAPFEVVVTTPEGAPVEGAAVAISSATAVPPYSFAAQTDAAGKCTGELVAFEGLYSFKVSKEGYKELAQDIDFSTAKLKKGDLATIKLSLGLIPASDYYNAAVKEINEGDFPAAQANFEKATAADPLLAIAHSALAQTHMAQADPAWLQKKKAEGALDAGLDIPGEIKRRAELALLEADTALALSPDDAGGLKTRYEALGLLGRAAEAEAALAVLAEKVPTPSTAIYLYNAGAQTSNSKDLDKAKQIEVSRRYFQQALAINPNLYQAHTGLAELSIREDKLEDAVTELSKAIEISPRNFKAYDRRIEVLKKIGDKERIAAAEQELAKKKGEN